MNIWPDNHDLYIDHPFTGNRTLRNTVNVPDSQRVNDNLLQVTVFLNIATWYNNVVCSFVIVNPGAISFPCTCMFPLAYISRQAIAIYAEQLPFVTNSYNIPRSCFAVMTSETANYLVIVL
jgi:hypothetical protein